MPSSSPVPAHHPPPPQPPRPPALVPRAPPPQTPLLHLPAPLLLEQCHAPPPGGESWRRRKCVVPGRKAHSQRGTKNVPPSNAGSVVSLKPENLVTAGLITFISAPGPT